jgi:hypothetical protein
LAFAATVVLAIPFSLRAADVTPEAWTTHIAEEFLRAYNEHYAAGDLDAWMSRWAADAVRESSRQHWKGQAEIRRAYQETLERWEQPGLVHERTRMVMGNRFAWQGFFIGRSKRTGRDVLVPIAIFLTFNEAGQVQHARFYLDYQHLVDQVEGRSTPQ